MSHSEAKISRLLNEHSPRVLPAGWEVWSCEECGRREYTTEETEALMRKHCPEWFEAKDADS